MFRGIRTCDICGITSESGKRVLNRHEYNMCMCEKHYQQMLRFGKTLDTNPRTIFDPNEIRITGDTVEMDCYDNIGNVIATTLLDKEDIDIILGKKWKTATKGIHVKKIYITTGNQHNGGPFYLHRLILNAPPGIEVDHIDGDTLNNRKSNLRFADRKIQTRNRSHRAHSRSGLLGVRETNKGTFQASIKKDDVYYQCRETSSLFEALYMRLVLERELYQEYRRNDLELYSLCEENLSISQRQEIEKYVLQQVI